MSLFDTAVGFVAPHVCIGCGSEGAVVCAACLVSAGEPPASRCAGCKMLTKNYTTCRSCRNWLDVYAVYVATDYSGLYERLLHEYKFGVKRQAVESIVDIMRSVSPHLGEQETTLVPLPTAPSRIRQRGFDHATLLAQRYAAKQQSPGAYTVALRALRRKSNTRQLGAGRSERIQQMKDEFTINPHTPVTGKTFLLIDDVTTTGASLAAAARTLKRAGAKRVYAVVYAQKI